MIANLRPKNQFTESWVGRDLKRLQQVPLLNDDIIKTVFDNVRNIGLSVLPLVAAKALNQKDLQNELLPWLNSVVSIGFYLLSLVLFLLNAFHGLKKLLELVKTPHRRKLSIVFIMVSYICIATFLYVFIQYK